MVLILEMINFKSRSCVGQIIQSTDYAFSCVEKEKGSQDLFGIATTDNVLSQEPRLTLDEIMPKCVEEGLSLI